MKKITKLTKKQNAAIPSYIDEWTKKGLTTTQMSAEDAKKDFEDFQIHILKRDTPAPVVLLNSPVKCWEAVVYSVSGNPNLPKEEFPDFIYPYFDCAFWASFFAFYDFCNKELGIKFTNQKEYDILKRCQRYGMVFPTENLCVVCQPPTVLKTNNNGLHCENGPAVSYSGDNEIYALNGVVMPKEYVMTPASKLKAKDILKEENVEIRRELIRKVGIERLMDDLPHKLLDKEGNYELYSIELSNEVKNAKFLKMINPSIKVFHVEGVGPDVKNVDEALKWRNNNMFSNAEILT